jgi:filamentous hemagglutinin
MPESGGGGGGMILRIALQFLKMVRERAAREQAATGPGTSPSSNTTPGQPRQPSVLQTLKTFSDYLFKPGATHGKDQIFRALGYGPGDSSLADHFIRQATERYSARDFVNGLSDQYGQRINIPIELFGRGDAAGQSATILSGWLVRPDGSLSLRSPYLGRG